LHALNRPNVLIVLAVFAVLLVASAFRRSETAPATGGRLTMAAAFVLAGAIVISPVTWRNWQVGHELVLISAPVGLDAYIGNNADADGTLKTARGVDPSIAGRWLQAPAVATAAMGHSASAAETSRYFLNQSLDWVKAHPLSELRLLAIKTRLAVAATFLPVTH